MVENGPRFSGPAAGNSGPITWLDAGSCIAGSSFDPNVTASVLVTVGACDGSAAQTWIATTGSQGISFQNKAFPNEYLWLNASGLSAHGGEGAWAYSFSPIVMAPIETADAPLTVTSPAPDEAFIPGSVIFTGHGEPGAEVTIRDADGEILATVTIDNDGYWETSAVLGSGPQLLHISDGTDTIDLTIVGTDDKETGPIIDAAVALGVLAAGAAGMTLTARRRKATSAL